MRFNVHIAKQRPAEPPKHLDRLARAMLQWCKNDLELPFTPAIAWFYPQRGRRCPAGFYAGSTAIYIRSDLSGPAVMATVAHECRHVWQQHTRRALCDNDANAYMKRVAIALYGGRMFVLG